MLTDTSDSDGLGLSADQCYLPAGWGSVIDKNQRLVAAQCRNGSFGVSDRTYGLEPHPCQVRSQQPVKCYLLLGSASPVCVSLAVSTVLMHEGAI